MNALHTVRDRVRPGLMLGILLVLGGATYVEFVFRGSPSSFDVALWILVVPLLLAAAVEGVRNHRLYQPLLYASFVAIGVLQYLDGDWYLLAGLFVLLGMAGLVGELTGERPLSTRQGSR